MPAWSAAITDPLHGFQGVNVETQRGIPCSLLNRRRLLLAGRAACGHLFGRGKQASPARMQAARCARSIRQQFRPVQRIGAGKSAGRRPGPESRLTALKSARSAAWRGGAARGVA